MAKRAATSAPALLKRTPVSRSRRIEAILGRDWKVALPFVLPIVVIMAGLIFWPFINAILLSFTVRNIVTRIRSIRRPGELRALVERRRLPWRGQ